MFQAFLFALLMLLYSQNSYAYIDPGILSVISQGLYAIVAGAVFTYIITPWHRLKLLMYKILKKEKNNSKKN